MNKENKLNFFYFIEKTLFYLSFVDSFFYFLIYKLKTIKPEGF